MTQTRCSYGSQTDRGTVGHRARGRGTRSVVNLSASSTKDEEPPQLPAVSTVKSSAANKPHATIHVAIPPFRLTLAHAAMHAGLACTASTGQRCRCLFLFTGLFCSGNKVFWTDLCGPCRCLPPTHTDNFLLINHTIQPSCSAPCEQLFSLICSRFIFFFFLLSKRAFVAVLLVRGHRIKWWGPGAAAWWRYSSWHSHTALDAPARPSVSLSCSSVQGWERAWLCSSACSALMRWRLQLANCCEMLRLSLSFY